MNNNEKDKKIKNYIEKVEILAEALPYVREFWGKTVVIKYGGSAMQDKAIQSTIMQDIALMKLVGMKPIIVHGGGPEINQTLNDLEIDVTFQNGLRVTDKKTMEVVEMVLTGKINKSIVSQLLQQGLKAVGISGKDAMLLKGSKKIVEGCDLGFVGNIDSVDSSIITTLLDNDFIPVISPIAGDLEGNTYNVNADYAAIAIASSLEAQKLVFLTDVEGVLEDVNDKSSVISFMTIDECDKMIKDGTISGGMLPKITSCIDAVKKGVKNVQIIDGRIEHCLLLEIFTQKGIGTLIKEK